MADYIQIKNGTTDAMPVPGEYGSSSTSPVGSYLKLADGTLIQWGNSMCTNPTGESNTMAQIGSTGWYSGSVALYTPLDFANTSFVVIGRSKYDTGLDVPFAFSSATNVHNARVRVYDNYARPLNDGKMKLSWLAIGRWK